MRAKRRWVEHVLLVALLVITGIGFSRSSKPAVSAVPAPPPVAAENPLQNVDDTLGRRGEPLATSAGWRETQVAGRIFKYCGNGSIDAPPTDVHRVIVIVHGNDRQACSLASSVLAAGTEQERATTLVVAPWFPLREDRVNPNTQLFWSFQSWSRGDDSANDDVRISSYAVVDEILERVRPLPTVVAGFSGGGQFVARYSAGTGHTPVRFIITNPSTYLYWTPERPGATRKQLANCPTYNDYRYGLNKLNGYMGAVGEETMKNRFAQHRVVYLLGDADNDPKSQSMDNSCAARTQGANRFERGERYWAYLPSVFGPEIHERHTKVVVPKVGHNAWGMFQHPDARAALFR
ncbi:MAG: hypothetical protein Q4G46_12175 [Propionibacteriaceae bacterium]|nr:hypothetical protein [Propionibacteriaceae bacterium]